jgi:hypothetical protein
VLYCARLAYEHVVGQCPPELAGGGDEVPFLPRLLCLKHQRSRECPPWLSPQFCRQFSVHEAERLRSGRDRPRFVRSGLLNVVAFAGIGIPVELRTAGPRTKFVKLTRTLR